MGKMSYPAIDTTGCPHEQQAITKPEYRRSPVSKTGLICPSFNRLFRTNWGAKFGNNLGTTPVHITATRRFYTPSEVGLGCTAGQRLTDLTGSTPEPP